MLRKCYLSMLASVLCWPRLHGEMSDVNAIHAVLAEGYDYRLVWLSIVIALLFVYAALDLAGHVTAMPGRARFAWLASGALALGIGIWSMHYLGMDALMPHAPMMYDWPTVLLSMFAAVFASGGALFVVSRKKMQSSALLLGSLLVGCGTATMHYIGIEATRLPARCNYSLGLVALSGILAIAISYVALRLTFAIRAQTESLSWGKLGGAILMCLAITVMHYVGMAAVRFTPAPLPASELTHTVGFSGVGLAGILLASILAMCAVFLTSYLDRRLSLRAFELQMSEERERTRLAQAACKAKSQLLEHISQGIRTPLNGIIGMNGHTPGTELSFEQRDYLETVKLSADSLLNVIDDVLNFPKIEAAEIMEATLKEERDPAISLDILLAEDDLVNQRLRKGLLEKRGHRVELVSNGREAVAALQKRRYDLVLMDVQMPEMDGLEAIELIRELEKTSGSHQPVMAMTALAMKGDRERCLAAGMDGYMPKPIRPQELDEFLERYMPASRGQVSPKGLDVVIEDAPQSCVLMEELLERVDGDRSFLSELLELLRGEYPQQIAAMEEAIAARNGTGLQRVAHALKGSLGNLAAPVASGFADELESCGRSGQMEQAHRYLIDLTYEIKRVIVQLESGCLEPAR